MAVEVVLVRHGRHRLLDRVLCGRMDGVGLSDAGRHDMINCALSLATEPVALLQASPTRRAMESAELLDDALGLGIESAPAMDEIEMGEWTGCTFADLEVDPRWRAWNSRRGTARPPGGESMAELQQRVVDHIEGLRSRRKDGRVVIVSHAEPIRAALLHYLGRPLDDFFSIELAPASRSTLRLDDDIVQVAAINERTGP